MLLNFKPLSLETWNHFEDLFGTRGACGGCWCMSWRLRAADFEKQKGPGNKKAIHKLVENKEHIGIIAYQNKQPIGWCSFGPRENFIRLVKSKVLAPLDDERVWSISCFFIAKEYRKMGISTELLKAVIKFAKKKKVKILEGYPIVPYSNKIPAAFAWTGLPSTFINAGFSEAARRSKSRPIMRIYL
jgi:GNAT superfamily N-acetyltransferase